MKYVIAFILSCTALHAQQMAMERAAEAYKKRLELAEEAKKTSLEKIDADYQNILRKTTEESKQKLNLAIRDATGKGQTEEADKLKELLNSIAGSGGAGESASSGALSNADCEKILDQLVGKWKGNTGTNTSRNKNGQMEVTSDYTYTYEFKSSKRMIRTYTVVYRDRSSDYVSNEEFKAMIRGDGKITFEVASLAKYRAVKDAPVFELVLPFNPAAPKLIHREMRNGNPITSTYNLTRIK